MLTPMRSAARGVGVGLPLLLLVTGGVLLDALPARAELSPTFTQSGRWVRRGGDLPEGDLWLSYSSLNLRSERWRLRTSVSWISWEADDPTAVSTPDRSGPGALHLVGGRRIWTVSTPSKGRSFVTWLRVRAKMPLQHEPSALGTGEPDWGASLLTTARLGRLFLITEAGFLDPGAPSGASYRSMLTGVISASYHIPGRAFFPLLSLVASSPSREGDPGYFEGSLGAGWRLGRRVHMSLLFSHGLSDISPREGVAIAVTLRP